MSDVFPSDLYSDKGFHYYADDKAAKSDRESYRAIVAAKGKPDKMVTVYRAVPKGVKEINNGDWVTLSREYAKVHGESNLDGEYDIISDSVPAKNLTNEGSFNEFGVRYLSTPQGEVYGFVKDGKMYLDPAKLSPELIAEEYTHIQQQALRLAANNGDRTAQKIVSAWDRATNRLADAIIKGMSAEGMSARAKALLKQMGIAESELASEVYQRQDGESAAAYKTRLQDELWAKAQKPAFAKHLETLAAENKLTATTRGLYEALKDFAKYIAKQLRIYNEKEWGKLTLPQLIERTNKELRSGKWLDKLETTTQEAQRKAAEWSDNLQKANETFNNELQQLIDGKLAKGHILKLGNAGAILQSTGIGDKPIELAASLLKAKSEQAEHPFDLSEVKDLGRAIQNPLAVFNSSTVDGRKVIFTELQHTNDKGQTKNFVVALEVDTKNKRGIEINDIRSVYPRENIKIIKSLTRDTERNYVDKQKMLEWLDKQQSNSAEVVQTSKQGTNLKQLIETAKEKVQKHENPISDSDVENVRWSIVGEKGASALDKEKESTHRMDNLGVAREMETANKTAKEIRLATGWERGKDGKWRYEILDGALRLPEKNGREINAINPQSISSSELSSHKRLAGFEGTDAEFEKQLLKKYYSQVYDITNQEYKLHDIFNSEELYKAYPELKDIKVEIKNQTSLTPNAEWVKHSNKVILYKPPTNLTQTDLSTRLKSLLLHEVQHAIQDIEGFAKGGSANNFKDKKISKNKQLIEQVKDVASRLFDSLPEDVKSFARAINREENVDKNYKELSKNKDAKAIWADYQNAHSQIKELQNAPNDEVTETAYEQYRKLAGEVEARNVQKRMNMTPEQRRETLLAETEDVAREDQNVIFDGLSVSEGIPMFNIVGKNANISEAQKASLVNAEALDKKGIDAAKIWAATGWQKDNGNWQTDAAPIKVPQSLVDKFQQAQNGEIITEKLGDLVDLGELGKLYPELAALQVEIFNDETTEDYANFETVNTRDGRPIERIAINSRVGTSRKYNSSGYYTGSRPSADNRGGSQRGVGLQQVGREASGLGQVQLTQLLTHEIQHWVQQKEGWPTASNLGKQIDAAKNNFIAQQRQQVARFTAEGNTNAAGQAQATIDYLQTKSATQLTNDKFTNRVASQVYNDAYENYLDDPAEIQSRNAAVRAFDTAEQKRNTPISESADTKNDTTGTENIVAEVGTQLSMFNQRGQANKTTKHETETKTEKGETERHRDQRIIYKYHRIYERMCMSFR